MASPILLILCTAAISGLVLAPPCTADNIMRSPGNLATGQSLSWSCYNLTRQSDCNLVLHDDGLPVWATNTSSYGGSDGGSACICAMQSDGNLVEYSGIGRAVWSSGTQGGLPNYTVVLQHDRDVVIYGPARWAACTHTGARGVAGVAQNSTCTLKN